MNVNTEDLIGPSDIARLCKVSANTVSGWRSRHGDFPTPVYGQGAHNKLYVRSEIEAWLRKKGKIK